jgi:cell division protein FtsN
MSANRSKNEKRPRKYLIELTSKTIIFWVLGSSFIFVWIFILGVLVGRGYLSFDLLKDKFAMIQEMVGGKDISKTEVIPGPVKDPKLDFYVQLSLTKDEAAKSGAQRLEANAVLENKPLAEGHQPPQVKPDSAVGPAPQGQPGGGQPAIETTPDQVSQKEPKTLPVSEEKTVSVIKPAPVPQTVPVTKTVRPVSKEQQEATLAKDKGPKEKVRQYVLSVGGFGDRAKALSLVKKLSGRGFNASLSNTKRGGRPYYRVTCGPFETEEMADAFKKSLSGRVGIYGVVTRAGN